MKLWPLHAGTRRPWYVKLLWIPLLFGLVTHWDFALPRVNVHYSQAGRDELRYIWNVQDRIDKGGMFPGGGATDHGVLFPDDEFFMEFSWWSKNTGRNHCISITPQWPHTHIYLNADGDIDRREKSGTDVQRLAECRWDRAKP
ncbi:hypothetical protein CW358_28805 [Pseudomonas protegens]|uniref:hypothetical protein n=1 Tax=Pseudomonas protegens TaxID=380021 RepID=UPI001010A58C|nr:hypothetical protein [Pseudomonas protegens]RXU60172.1 hypothetical protein CW358_28805 [Pseudomonas protegens]